MKRYKLTTKDMTTHRGHKWEVGVEQVIDKPGNSLCSDQVFHFYDSPEIAVLMNPMHAAITNPVLWEVDCDEVAHDGTKGGAKRMVLVKKIKAPKFTTLQKQVFVIKCALAVYKENTFVAWARGYLSGKDRSTEAAYAAARAAADAADAARAARADAAAYAATYAAAYVAARAATYAAAYVAARAAARAAADGYAAYAAAAADANVANIRRNINAAAKLAANFKR